MNNRFPWKSTKSDLQLSHSVSRRRLLVYYSRLYLFRGVKRYHLFTGYMTHVHRADEDHALLVNIADHSHSLTHGCKSHTQVTLTASCISHGCKSRIQDHDWFKHGCYSCAQIKLIVISSTHVSYSRTRVTLIVTYI